MVPVPPLWLWFQQPEAMAVSLALLLPVLLVILAITLTTSKEEASTSLDRRRLPPSPRKLPFIGNLHQVGSHPHRALAALSRRHGPLMLLQLGQAPTLVVTSAAVAEEVMKTQGAIFADRPALEFPKKLLYGCRDMGFLPYGEEWRNLRKVTNLHLLGPRRVPSYRLAREEEVAFMVGKIERLSSSSSSGAVDLREILQDFVIDLISRAVRGRCFRDEGQSGELRELLHEHSTLFSAFYVGDYYPWLRWVSVLTGIDSRVKRVVQKWDRVLESIIQEHLHRSEVSGGSHPETFVDALLAFDLGDPSSELSFTTETIKAVIIDMFSAGTDTSYITLEWAMAELVRSPELMKKAQAEVRRAAGAKPSIEEPDIAQMRYLKAVIKETLRLHPAAPMLLPRQSSEETHVCGYYVPKHTRVLVNAWAIMRDSELWEAPEEFRPERFLQGGVSVDDLRGGNLRFIPFGAGRRICPGAQFAVSAVELVLANLLHRFDWKMPDGMQAEDLDMGETPGVLTARKQSLCLVPVPYVHSAI
ncbi:hypothetical protein Taro_026024 [Colocasia esculenta]|uniref:Cytochrome P450 71A1 n=1 Tax=Colocasia esculenta TaxID=4460 RepID=A0A843VMC4_COLES|nr:hypothetical protein [Colocasia esculenta]